jgi:hypothetical protein
MSLQVDETSSTRHLLVHPMGSSETYEFDIALLSRLAILYLQTLEWCSHTMEDEGYSGCSAFSIIFQSATCSIRRPLNPPLANILLLDIHLSPVIYVLDSSFKRGRTLGASIGAYLIMHQLLRGEYNFQMHKKLLLLPSSASLAAFSLLIMDT